MAEPGSGEDALPPGLKMPAGSYDAWAGELRLYDPVEVPLDAELRRFVRAARGLSPAGRRETGASLRTDESYTLLAFARRSSVFAMRRRDPDVLVDGMVACMVLDPARTDERDTLVALAMLHHAAGRMGQGKADLMQGVAEPASEEVASLVKGYLQKPAPERDLRDAWGHVEVEAPGGIGLLQWGFGPWLPVLDVTGAAVRIAAAISETEYLADDPMLAVEMPRIWLSDADDPSLGSILGSVRAAAVIHGRLRPEASDAFASQQLSTWIVETADEGAADRLLAMARHGRTGAALLGVAAGRLFTLVAARSFVQGVESFETTASLERFGAPIAVVLANTTAGHSS